MNPIPMILYCPRCHLQHIDRDESLSDREWAALPASDREPPPAWTNPPHRSHLCKGCGCIWRPADVPTVGVASIATRGKNDDHIIAPIAVVPTHWHPIESAPKDNKRSLYLAKFNEAGEMVELDFNGSWEGDRESWEIPNEYYYWASENGIEEPTHWAYQEENSAVDFESLLRTAIDAGVAYHQHPSDENLVKFQDAKSKLRSAS